MCGIFSIFSREAPVPEALLRDAIRTLHHRGPENAGVWSSPDRKVGLAHARLSLVDLQTGHQPIVSARGNVIVANGEIYGYRALRDDLQRRGWRFTTQSDSEVALALYERHGLGFVEHLRGEFAFAIWDRSNDTLVCVRDRFGIKPLYYTEDRNRVMLASEVKALLAAGVPARLDRQNFLQHLLLMKPQGATLFDSVRQVPPGCMLVVSRGATVLRRYWDMDYPTHPAWPDDAASREQAREALAEHVIDAVETRLHADVQMGHYLSGGVDSSAVLGVACKHLGRPLTAFNVKFDHEAYDENAVAAATARFAGAELRSVAVDATDFADHMTQVVWHAESIGINSNAAARYLQSKAVQQAGFKAVLSGDGADELFYGYNFHLMDHLLSGFEGDESARHARFNALHQAGSLSAAIPAPWTMSSNHYASTMLGFTPAWISIVLRNRIGLRDRLLAPDLRQEIDEDQLVAGLLADVSCHDQLRGRHPVQQAMYLWVRSVLCNQVLFADRLDMANSVEVRMPLLDHKLYEFTRGLPVSWFFRPGEEKSLFRDAMRPFLTEQVFNRAKMPFFAPPATLQQDGKLFELMQDVLRSSALERLGLFDRTALSDIADSLRGKTQAELAGMEAPLMLILTTYLLCKQFDLTT